MLINSTGQQKESACFERDKNTEAFYSCSIQWKNKLHIFGGLNEKRQISRLTGHKLERVGSLAFEVSDIEEPPVGSFSHYAVVFHVGNFYYFGGYDTSIGRSRSSILCLNAASWTWSNVGQLNSGRHTHAVTLVNKTFIVIGGIESQGGTPTFTKAHEVCLLNDEKVACTESFATLTDYRHMSGLFLVNQSYGNC